MPLIHPHPDPVAFSLGPVAIHWYGLMYLLAFALFLALGRIRIKQPHIAAQGWKKEHLDDMLFYGMLGVIIGGRLGEVLFYEPAKYFAHPLEIFMIWQGGMSFHGGFLGVVVGMLLWSRKVGKRVGDVYDFMVPLVPLGYACGRIGNFINAELPGRLADPSLPWAMIWPGVAGPRHPSPLYQALVDGLLVFVLLWAFAARQRPRWAVGAMFMILYGCARFFTEYFRVPDWQTDKLGFVLTSGQVLSLPMIIVGAALMVWAYQRQPQSPHQPLR
ncbi:MAG: prolipoprotein diacylglyceryl transferase [Pseudomonadota bacterium]|nr:prolipoprotein diacylglyceryl transferase [Pseudomonadota bacterium]